MNMSVSVTRPDILQASSPSLRCAQLTFGPPKSLLMKPRMCEASSHFHTEVIGFWDVSVRLRSYTYLHPDALPLRGCASISNPRSILSSSWLRMSCCESLRPPSTCLFRIYIKFQIEVHLHPAAATPEDDLDRMSHFNKTLLCLTYSVNVVAHNLYSALYSAFLIHMMLNNLTDIKCPIWKCY